MEGFYRTHRFAKCLRCKVGLICQDDYASLKSGYWWRWRNDSYKHRYQDFIQNLLATSPVLDNSSIQYPYSMPTPYRCQVEKSCKGGLDSPCAKGYEGPVCAVCSSGYHKKLEFCEKCPSKVWIVAQLSIVLVILSLLFAILMWKRKTKLVKDEGHYLIDMFFFQAQNTSWLLSGHAWLIRCVLVHRMARFSASCPHVLWNTSVEFLSDRTCSLSIFRVARECLWRIAPDIIFEFKCHWRLWCMLPYI